MSNRSNLSLSFISDEELVNLLIQESNYEHYDVLGEKTDYNLEQLKAEVLYRMKNGGKSS